MATLRWNYAENEWFAASPARGLPIRGWQWIISVGVRGLFVVQKSDGTRRHKSGRLETLASAKLLAQELEDRLK